MQKKQEEAEAKRKAEAEAAAKKKAEEKAAKKRAKAEKKAKKETEAKKQGNGKPVTVYTNVAPKPPPPPVPPENEDPANEVLKDIGGYALEVATLTPGIGHVVGPARTAIETYQKTDDILTAVGAGIEDAAIGFVGGKLIKAGGNLLKKWAKSLLPKLNVPKLAFAAEGPAPKFTPRPTPKANSTPKPKTPAAKPKTEKAPKAEAPKQQRVVPTREMQNACWDKLKQSGEWSHSKGHSKPTLENKKTGQFLQKSIEKWELEAFDKHENHIGIMRPNEPGIIRTEFSVRGRKMGK